MPERTDLAGARHGILPFLEIKAGDPDKEEVFFAFNVARRSTQGGRVAQLAEVHLRDVGRCADLFTRNRLYPHTGSV